MAFAAAEFTLPPPQRAYSTGADASARAAAVETSIRQNLVASADALRRAVADDAADDGAGRPTVGRLSEKLTAREREVVGLLADGLSAKEVAVRLSLSNKTVESHRANAMNRLGLCGVAELTKYAVLEGLTPLVGRRIESPVG